ncbi:right-handed parallel beta-helix repeat-containing protein [Natrarchaeobius sp. A-rgal3]|uniref:right-handed parallel beta-helix repeat-containing protein n=1 Tax=Natrarchaeobius versutus TaxID=1679078 RepID=UPI00351054C3
MEDASTGIRAQGTEIYDNDVAASESTGLVLRGGAEAYDNTVTDSGEIGVDVDREDNLVRDNEIVGVATSTDGAGVMIEDVENRIENNTIEDVASPGMRVDIYSIGSNTTIVENEITGVEGAAIELELDRNETSDRPALTRMNMETESAVEGELTIRRSQSIADVASDEIEPPETESVGYFSIDSKIDDDVETTTFDVTVPNDRLEDGHNPVDVSIYHYDGNWVPLEATVLDESDDLRSYEIVADNVSTIAVGVGDIDPDDEDGADVDTDLDETTPEETDDVDTSTRDDSTDETDDDTPGFGMVVTLIAILALLTVTSKLRE